MKQKRTENENCLIGMKCPECGSLEPFDIHSQIIVKVYDGGTDEYRSVEWTDESLCMCCSCQHLGTVTGFIQKNPKVPIKLPCYGIVVQLDGKGSGTIDSELHDDGEGAEISYALDGIESMILAHACAEIDISTPAYMQGIEIAVDSVHNIWG